VGAEITGSENEGPQNNNTWKMPDLEMTDKVRGWKMEDKSIAFIY